MSNFDIEPVPRAPFGSPDTTNPAGRPGSSKISLVGDMQLENQSHEEVYTNPQPTEIQSAETAPDGSPAL